MSSSVEQKYPLAPLVINHNVVSEPDRKLLQDALIWSIKTSTNYLHQSVSGNKPNEFEVFRQRRKNAFELIQIFDGCAYAPYDPSARLRNKTFPRVAMAEAELPMHLIETIRAVLWDFITVPDHMNEETHEWVKRLMGYFNTEE